MKNAGENMAWLPLVEKTALHWFKADLEAIPENYVFLSIDDIKNNFKINYGHDII